jgi:hypothetical protein
MDRERREVETSRRRKDRSRWEMEALKWAAFLVKNNYNSFQNLVQLFFVTMLNLQNEPSVFILAVGPLDNNHLFSHFQIKLRFIPPNWQIPPLKKSLKMGCGQIEVGSFF